MARRPTIRDLVDNWDDLPEYILHVVGTDKLQDEVQRALDAGAEPPLTWVGCGATACVFCDSEQTAYKVSHYDTDHFREIFEREYEWLETAFEAGLPVAEPYALNLEEIVLVRYCPVGRPPGNTRSLQTLHYETIANRMRELGWTMPEYKEDSYVVEDGKPILVDASAPLRIGKRMLRYAREVLSGKRDLYEQSPRSIAADLDTEVLMDRLEAGQTVRVVAELNDLAELQDR